MRGMAALLLLAGCDQAMRDQPRVKPLGPSSFFPDGAGARPRPAGTIPRGGLDIAERPRITKPDMLRGRQRYGIACAPCHGTAGDGDGMVALRGFPRPASLHEPAVRALTAEQVVTVIRDGKGKMPPHGYLVAPEDRWRIAAYVRSLQLSRRVDVQRLRPDERARLP